MDRRSFLIGTGGLTLEQEYVRQIAEGVRFYEREEARGYVPQDRNPFRHYQGDVLAFCQTELKERYTPDQLRIFHRSADADTVLLKTANGVGKTRLIAGWAIGYFFCWADAQVVTFMAPPEDNLKLQLWGEIGSFVERFPRLFDGLQTVSIAGTTIKRNADSYLVGVAIPQAANPNVMKARFSGKHSPHQAFAGDEIDAVPKPIFQAIETCASGSHVKRLYAFNPRQPSGPAYDMEQNKEGEVVSLSAFTHPNVLEGEDIIPGAVTREVTVWRINKWSRPLKGDEKRDARCFEVPRFLEGYVAKERDADKTPMPPLLPGVRMITNPELAYVVLGIYPPDSEWQLIPTWAIEAAKDRWLSYVAQKGELAPSGIRPLVGLDVGDQGADLSVYTERYGTWVPRPKDWQGKEPDETGEIAGDYARSSQASLLNIDGTGVGAGSCRPARRKVGVDCLVQKVMVQSSSEEVSEEGEFYSVRDEMLWSMREWFIREPAMIPPTQDNRLEKGLKALTYDKTPGRGGGQIKVIDSKTLSQVLGFSADHVMSLGLTFVKKRTGGGFGQQNYLQG